MSIEIEVTVDTDGVPKVRSNVDAYVTVINGDDSSQRDSYGIEAVDLHEEE